jgi:D-cysteine desulfhydrase
VKSYLSLALLLCLQLNATSLFRAYPTLEKTIPIEHIANLPTPITECTQLERALHHPHLYMKNDAMTGTDGLYGGNKVRKLEFLLGDAKKHNAKTIITYGCFGTNHGLATACYANKLGYNCILMLKPQPNTHVVRNNLLLDHYFGATIQTFPDNDTRNAAREALLQADSDAYFFPTGGSIPLGALGFVNAAFELKEQIDQGLMPEPNYIYVALGSAGTTAGLLLGLKLAGLHSKICAIAVEPEETLNEFEENVYKLFAGTNELLREHDANIPHVEFPHDQIIFNKTLMGPDYGVWIPEGDAAMRVMQETEKIELEGTYSAKAVAAIIADLKNGVRKADDVILFWNTYCGLDFSHLTRQVQYQDLNPEFHVLFAMQA